MGTVESWTNFERYSGEIIGARERFEVFCAEFAADYEQSGTAVVLYITETESKRMLLDRAGNIDIEFFVRDSVKEKDISTARGIFLNSLQALRQRYFAFEVIPEESTRVFFYVEDYGQYVWNIIGESSFIEQNNHMYLTILKDYLEVCVYSKDRDGKFKQKYMFTPCIQDDECLNLYYAVIDENGNAYCSTSSEKLIYLQVFFRFLMQKAPALSERT